MRAKDFIVEKVITEKNVPTNPSKWSYYKNQAKKKFDVYPSAYANAWAAKKYKAAGGKWKTESVEHNKPITELNIAGETTKNLEYYYNRFKDAKTPTEMQILRAIRKELDRRNGRQPIAADKYTTENAFGITQSELMQKIKDEPNVGIKAKLLAKLKILQKPYFIINKNKPASDQNIQRFKTELEAAKWLQKNGPMFSHGGRDFEIYKGDPEQLSEAEQSPYAIGMAKAMKMYKDKPPLAKKTIKKAHEIAKAIQKD